MEDKLLEWLRMRWRYDNLPKYQKYFDDWINNLTLNQIKGYSIQLSQIENGSMEKWNTKK